MMSSFAKPGLNTLMTKLVIPSGQKFLSLSQIRRNLSLHHQISGRKRFYKKVDVIRIEGKDDIKDISGKNSSTLYGITLDGKTLKTPARNHLVFNNYLLAALVASEWDAQTDTRKGIQPSTMPFMQLASTAIDNLQFDPSPAQSTCLSFLPTDCSLFWTKEDSGLYKKQEEKFRPILSWLNELFSIELLVAEGMTMRLAHPAETTRKVKAIIDALDPFSLACLQCATMECKSVVLAFALLFGRIDVEEAKLLSRMEEEHQLEMWGLVEGGHDMDRLNNAGNLSAASTFFNLLHSQDPTAVQAVMQKLAKLKKELRSLSNFWICDVVYDGRIYGSGEHCFHGEKFTYLSEMEWVPETRRNAMKEHAIKFQKGQKRMTCADAKKMGGRNGFLLTQAEQDAWTERSVQVQQEICRYKLRTYELVRTDLRVSGEKILIHPALRCSANNLDKLDRLIFCGNAMITDGQLKVVGRNELGRIWMSLRACM